MSPCAGTFHSTSYRSLPRFAQFQVGRAENIGMRRCATSMTPALPNRQPPVRHISVHDQRAGARSRHRSTRSHVVCRLHLFVEGFVASSERACIQSRYRLARPRQVADCAPARVPAISTRCTPKPEQPDPASCRPATSPAALRIRCRTLVRCPTRCRHRAPATSSGRRARRGLRRARPVRAISCAMSSWRPGSK